MRILGIDPADTKASWVLLDPKRSIIKKAERIVDGKKKHNTTMDELYKVMNEEDIDFVAIEDFSPMGMPLGTTSLQTLKNIGRLDMLAEGLAIPHALIPRKDIKMSMCGSMRAKDGNITQALKDRWGEPGKKASPGFTYGIASDNWQALAVATIALDTYCKELED